MPRRPDKARPKLSAPGAEALARAAAELEHALAYRRPLYEVRITMPERRAA